MNTINQDEDIFAAFTRTQRIRLFFVELLSRNLSRESLLVLIALFWHVSEVFAHDLIYQYLEQNPSLADLRQRTRWLTYACIRRFLQTKFVLWPDFNEGDIAYYDGSEPDSEPLSVIVEPQSTLGFDPVSWPARCQAMAKTAHNGCGLSHGYYVDIFSKLVDVAVVGFTDDQKAAALSVAEQWDYCSESDRDAAQVWNAENGWCSHGIELGCCPAGCGS